MHCLNRSFKYMMAWFELIYIADQFLWKYNRSLKKFGEVRRSSEKFGESSEKFGESSEIDTKEMILNQMRLLPSISAKDIAQSLGITSRAVEKNIKILREEGRLIRQGSARAGHWKVIDK